MRWYIFINVMNVAIYSMRKKSNIGAKKGASIWANLHMKNLWDALNVSEDLMIMKGKMKKNEN